MNVCLFYQSMHLSLYTHYICLKIYIVTFQHHNIYNFLFVYFVKISVLLLKSQNWIVPSQLYVLGSKPWDNYNCGEFFFFGTLPMAIAIVIVLVNSTIMSYMNIILLCLTTGKKFNLGQSSLNWSALKLSTHHWIIYFTRNHSVEGKHW